MLSNLLGTLAAYCGGFSLFIMLLRDILFGPPLRQADWST
jgi:hypothetical protein